MLTASKASQEIVRWATTILTRCLSWGKKSCGNSTGNRRRSDSSAPRDLPGQGESEPRWIRPPALSGGWRSGDGRLPRREVVIELAGDDQFGQAAVLQAEHHQSLKRIRTRRERKPLPVRRPERFVVILRAGRQRAEARSVGPHDVDVPASGFAV